MGIKSKLNKLVTGNYTEDEDWGNCTDWPIDTEPYFCQEMIQLVKSIRNRCDVLLAISGFDDLCVSVPTLIEDLYGDAQDLVGYCVEDDDA